MLTLNICHLYPDILNLYGDNGNISCLSKRLSWRGIQPELTSVSIGQSLDIDRFDLFFIGGGQDFERELILRDLEESGKKSAICRAVDEEKVFLAICGGYQLLGTHYESPEGGRYDFIGAIDCYTKAGGERFVGDYVFTCEDIGGESVVGFENHSGKTFLGEGPRPLGIVRRGFGNNGEDKTEGARYKNVYCSYSHGPMLPKNPLFCDHLLKTALQRKYGKEIELAPLNDEFENSAYTFMKDRLTKG